jgi:hypothetical protein
LPPRFLLHFGYDFRLAVAVDVDVDVSAVLESIRADGLFVYERTGPLATIDRWLGRPA